MRHSPQVAIAARKSSTSSAAFGRGATPRSGRMPAKPMTTAVTVCHEGSFIDGVTMLHER